MEISAYRQQLMVELATTQEQVDANCVIALEGTKSDEEREAAIRNVAGCLNADNVTKMLDLVYDVGASAALRSAAIRATSGETRHDEEYIQSLFSILEDSDEPVVMRAAVLDVLEQSRFHSPLFRTMRAEYHATLRTLIDDKDKSLRHRAIEILAYENDEYVQSRLVESIEARSNRLIGITQAIQLLSSDLHAENSDLLTRIVIDPPSRSAKVAAIRAIAADSSSKELLAEHLRDKDEDREVRHAVATALCAVAPDDFEDLAKEIVFDEDDYEDLQALTLTALNYCADTKALYKDLDFHQRVKRLTQKAIHPELKQAAATYLVNAAQADSSQNSVYEVENQWGGSEAAWHDGGTWLIGSRAGQQVVSLDVKSDDNGQTLVGTMIYEWEGPIGFRARHTHQNNYVVENQWGGANAPWHAGGTWQLGSRAAQRVVAIDILSDDGGNNLHGTITYEDEGPIGFRAALERNGE